jgi:hypothetical protein
LRQKLDYAAGRTKLKSAEQFIDLAGSSSTLSGKPYLVKCPGAAAVESHQWLLAELAAIRSSTTARHSRRN